MQRRSNEMRAMHAVVNAAIALCVIAIAPSATAEIVLSDPALTIEVSSSDGSAILEVPLADLIWDSDAQVLDWNPGQAIEFADQDGAVSLAVLESLQFDIERCGKIALSFNLRAGARDATVVVRSGLLEFPSIASDQAQARASAGFTLRDLDQDGSYLYGLPGDGTGACRAYYNGNPDFGARFAHLVAMISTGSGGTASASQSNPTVGYRSVGQEVQSCALELAFVISDHDRATVSASFDLAPDPDICGLDSDGDGVPDWLDGCPDNPELTQPGDDGCGAPSGDDDDGDDVEPDDQESPGDPIDDASPDDLPGGQPSSDDPRASLGNSNSSGASGSSGAAGSGDDVYIEQLDQLLGGGVAPCGAGIVSLLPVMILGLAGAKSGFGRRRI